MFTRRLFIVSFFVISVTFLLTVVPLLVSTSLFFPFITGKAFLFRIVIEIAAVLWLILALSDSRYRPRRSWILWAVIALVAVLSFATVLGVNPYHSFWSNFERMEGLISSLHLLLYFLVLISLLKIEKLWFWFLHTSLGVNAIIGIYALVQLSGGLVINQGGVRVDATFGNATYLAVYELFHIFFLLILLARRVATNWWWRATYLVLLVLDLFLLYRTGTRGAILGLLGGVCLASILAVILERRDRTFKKWGIGVLVLIVVLVAGFFTLRHSNFVRNHDTLNRLASISFSEIQSQGRYFIWPMAIKGFLERPILGWGPENFVYVFNKNYDPRMYSHEQWFDRAHNVVLDQLIAGGILGLLAYLSLFVTALYYLWFASRGVAGRGFTLVERSLFTGLLAAYFFHNLFVFDNLISSLLFFALLAYFHHRSVSGATQSSPVPAAKLSPVMMRVVGGGLALALLASLYFLNLKPFLAGRYLIRAISSSDPAESLRYYQDLFALRTFGSIEAREQLVQSAINLGSSAAPDEIKSQFINLAKTETQRQLAVMGEEARAYFFAGTLYSRLSGGQAEAEKYFQRAIELSPRKPAMRLALADLYLGTGHLEEAVITAREAYELEPRFVQARDRYALVLIYAGRNQEAEKILADAYGDPSLVDTDEFLNAYAATKQYNKVLKLWQKRVASNPDSAPVHASLAMSYWALNQRGKAVAELQKAAELDPKLQTEVDKTIKAIQSGVRFDQIDRS